MFTSAKLIIVGIAIFSLVGIVGLHFHHDSSVRAQLAAAKSLNTKRETEIKALTDIRQAEIDAANKAANDIIKTANDEKDAALKNLGLEHINRLELTKRIEALNEKHSTDLASIKHNYDERLRLDGINSSTKASKESERFAQLSRSAPECDGIVADYYTLKEACQLTTLDFNSCRLAYDADTAACGRYK